MNRIGIGTGSKVAPEALVKPGRVGVLDVGSSMGCGAGLLLGLGGSGAWAFAGGIEGEEADAMASTGSVKYLHHPLVHIYLVEVHLVHISVLERLLLARYKSSAFSTRADFFIVCHAAYFSSKNHHIRSYSHVNFLTVAKWLASSMSLTYSFTALQRFC